MKKINTTIFIPACNEEENIANILHDILSQKTEYLMIDKIIVLSDGSTDKTVKKAKEVKSKKLLVFDYKKRLGKMKRCNQIFAKFNSNDVFIQLDADIRLANKNTLEELIKPFSKISNLAMSCGTHVAIKPETLAERISYFGYLVWERAIRLAGNPEKYFCIGQIRAFSKSFLNELRFPSNKTVLAEDTWSFYFAKSKKLKTTVAKKAIVYFRLPNILSEYKTQTKRFLTSSKVHSSYFEKELIAKYSTLTTKHKIAALIIELTKSPIIGIIYLFIQLETKLEARHFKSPETWYMATSTKKLKI